MAASSSAAAAAAASTDVPMPKKRKAVADMNDELRFALQRFKKYMMPMMMMFSMSR
jgi:hypothetical protein